MNFGIIAGMTDGLQANLPTWDLLVLGFFGLGAFLYGFTADRKQTVVLFLSFYISFCIASNVPAEVAGSSGDSFFLNAGILRAVVFSAIFVFLFFQLSSNLYPEGPPYGPLWQRVMMPIGLAGLLLSCALTLLPVPMASVFGETVAFFFLGTFGKIFWFSFPVFCFALLFQKRYWD